MKINVEDESTALWKENSNTVSIWNIHLKVNGAVNDSREAKMSWDFALNILVNS